MVHILYSVFPGARVTSEGSRMTCGRIIEYVRYNSLPLSCITPPDTELYVISFYTLYEGPGCESWSLTLRVELRLRVFENRMLRRVFGPNRDEVTGEWRKLHNEEFSDLYSSLNIIKKNEMGRACSRYGERRGA
jgi:hypothetical protein